MKNVYRILIFILAVSVSNFVSGQSAAQKESQRLEKLKKAGKLDYSKIPVHKHVLEDVSQRQHYPTTSSVATSQALCNCEIPQDTTFAVVPFTGTGCSGTPGLPPLYRNDDGFTGTPVALPFTFHFYGTNYTSVFINNNGNLSFNTSYCTFTANGFPDATHAMIAPFWGDVDTRDTASGVVYYKLTAHALIVKWDTVGYFGMHADLKNTFQLIMTDGTDPILPPGYNVSFCYGDMQWTTGDASQGSGGFGGTPATVGINAGDGINFAQIGTFGMSGTNYISPTANNGVDFLDDQAFFFNAAIATGSTNIPPIVHGLTVCDTLIFCASDSLFSDTIPLNFSFLSPEANQITTVTAIGPPNFTVFNNVAGNVVNLSAQIILTNSTVGLNNVTFIATDNGTPPATDSITVSFRIDTFPLAHPVITGSNFYCIGGSGVTLHTSNNYQSFLWSTGVTGVDSLHVMTGTYNVEVTDVNGCRAKSLAFPVWEIHPHAEITGVTAVCGQNSAHLTTTQHFQSYHWSNNSTNDSIEVGTGSYYVIVTDTIGCIDTSATFNVVVHPYPTALFAFTPQNAPAGDTIHFTDLSVAGSGNIVGWLWDFGDGPNSTSTLQNPTHVYTALGTYPVTLTVTQSDGCTKTIIINYEGLPNEVIPFNIFTPNGDGANETFFFKNLQYYPNSKLEVFNRWGRKVYESSNYQNDWKGGDLSDGVYYYILKIPEKNTLKGTVTIKR